MIILDANVLVFSCNVDAEHDRKCRNWIETTIASGEVVGIPWHSVMAFLRITTTPGLMRRPLQVTEAFELIGRWNETPGVTIPTPGPRFRGILEEIAKDSGTRGRAWSDAYLGALAIEIGANFATFDRDFRKFKGLKLVEL